MAFSNHVKIKFGADTKGFHTGIEKAESRVKKFGKVFKDRLIGTLGTAVIANTTKDVINFGASIGDMASRLGTTTDFLQALQFGAEQSGVKAEGATIAFQRFTRRTAEAKEKAGPLRDTLEKLGITMKDAEGNAKSTEQLFNEFGEALSNIEDPAVKVKTAFQFLDTEGVALAQMFTKGGKSISQYGEEAKRLGMVMTNDTIEALRKADGELLKMSRGFKVFVSQIIPPVIKILKSAKIGFDLVVLAIQNFPTAIKIAGQAIKGEIIDQFKVAIASLKVFESEIKSFAVKINPFMDEADLQKAERGIKQAQDNLSKAQEDADKTLKQRKEEIFRADEGYAKTREAVQQKLQVLQEKFNTTMGKGTETRKSAIPPMEKLVGLSKEEQDLALKTATARDQNTLAIERSTQKLKALIDGGEEARKAVQERHDLEDEINKLVTQGKIPRAEAEKVALKLAGHAKAEQALLVLIKAEKERLKVLGDQQAQEEERIEGAMRDQLALQKQAKVAINAELAVLQAKANGQDALAQKLQAEINIKNDLAALADQMALKELDAVATLEKKLQLEKDIELKQVDQEAQLLQNGIVAEQAERQIRDAVDFKDKKRIRAAKEIERIEEKIKALQAKGGERAEAEIAKLEAVKERKLELVLDDQTKADLQQLEAKRLEIEGGHDVQMKALQDRMADLQVEEQKVLQAEQKAKAEAKARNAEAEAQFQAKKAEIEADLNKQMGDNKNALEKVKTSHVNAFKELAKNIVNKFNEVNFDNVPQSVLEAGSQVEEAIKNIGYQINNTLNNMEGSRATDARRSETKIPAPQVNVNVAPPSIPSINNDVNINIESDMLQSTQEEILSTLQGKFVNQ